MVAPSMVASGPSGTRHKHTPLGLSFAAPCLRPAFIKPSRPRGAKAAGLRFERALAKALPLATHGQWFHYLARSGPGWCQTDLLLEGTSRVVVIEVKLGAYAEAQEQLQELYLPVLRHAFPTKQVSALIALRHVGLVPPGVAIFDQLSSALQATPGPELGVFHWLGRGPTG